jgi:hypothetical protein
MRNVGRNKKGIYLSAVKVMPAKIRQILLRKRHSLHPLQHAHSLNKHLKNTLLRLRAKLPVSQRDMNTALEGVVEGFNAVGG